MVIPASGQFQWHVNQSTQPLVLKSGQTDSWTLTCEQPEGTVLQTQTVQVGRGQARSINPCPPAPGPGGGGGGGGETPSGGEPPSGGGPPLPSKAQVRVKTKLSASFDGRLYRVRVKGSLLDFGEDANRCAGNIALTVTASGRRLASGRAPLDGACGFERTLKFKSRKSRRSLRVVAKWSGNDFLLGAERNATTRVKKRRR
jgi:hypothetical protein